MLLNLKCGLPLSKTNSLMISLPRKYQGKV